MQSSSPILSRTKAFSSSVIFLSNVSFWFGVMKQYKHSPFTGCGRETTAASETRGCSVKTDSTSAVDIKWPETFNMSSTRPVIHKYPSWSRRAPEIRWSLQTKFFKPFIKDLTIASAVISWKFGEVCRLESRMIVENCAHHSWPWLRKDQISFALALNLSAAFIQQQRFHAEEWKWLQIWSLKWN